MKSKIFVGLFLIVILISNFSLAVYSNVSMEVVEEPVATIPMGENSKFEKKLVGKDLTNKEVTIQLQVTNDEIASQPSAEIVFVLDNSDSMLDEVLTDTATNDSSKTRKDVVFESAGSIITTLLAGNANLKISVVSFSTNTNQDLEGTISDATVVSTLTDDATALNNSISNIEANGHRTNLEAGLLLGSQQFSNENNNKYLIVLTDGVPNVAINYDKHYYSDDVINKTITQLESILSKGIHISTMLTKVDDSYVPAGVTKSFGNIINEIFGTMTNPKYGNFFYIPDSEIEKTIKEDIYNSLIPTSKALENITIVDYFPEEIVKNFDFSYVSDANLGNISSSIDTTNNSITWTIPKLDVGQTATVQYKLKLKEDYDSAIVDKLLNTNEKVDSSYTDVNGKNKTGTTDVTPKLKLSEPPTILPQTGSVALIGVTILSTGLVIFSVIKLAKLNKKMN